MPHQLTPSEVRPAPVDVAALIRDASADDHRAAENRGFVVRLMAGELSLDAYSLYLAQLAPVYSALASRAPGGWELFDPRYDRVDAIRADQAALGSAPAALPGADAHAARVRELIAAGDDVRYLAHHYTRYLGDLSGGQAIAALMARHYGATPDQLTFFDFSALGRPVEVKRHYREQLNALALDGAQTAALVDEVRTAFRMTTAIFDALDRPQQTDRP